jgi:hypothetical protein
MKNLLFLSVITLACTVNVTQATTVTTVPSVTIQGGSNANAVWRAPLSQTYKVSVLVPATATATNAVYLVYPKGKAATSTLCSPTTTKPCFEIFINQALNKNKWVQLTVNNDVNTAWTFVKNTGYVTVTSNALATTENLGLASLVFETIYSKIANNGVVLADTAALGAMPTNWACSRNNLTGLMWEIKTDDGGLQDKDNGYSWYAPNPAANGGDVGYQNLGVCTGGISCDTDSYVNAVNAQKLCGFNDWRMPSNDELLELATKNYNALYFPNTVDGANWSSTPVPGIPQGAWYVYSYSQTKTVDWGRKDRVFGIRLVRGGH